MKSASIVSYFIGAKGGLLMSVIAFSIVFLVIAALMLLMMALKHFSGWVNVMSAAQEIMKKQSKPDAAPEEPAPASAPPAPLASAQASFDGEDELIAVLTAAVTAACGDGTRVLGYAPAAVRGSSPRPASAWRMTGILQNS
ncbi:MAG: OadG family protein, partial [Synergistaceae bacterium]|nr:OadG family protein [Synergistaceae bacterium]